MKKVIFLLIMMICLSSAALAADVKVQINGEIIDFKDSEGNTVNAQIVNSRTMVPMRKIFEVLGATVEWNGEERKVTGTKGDTVIELQIDNDMAQKIVNGKKENILLDTAPMIIDDRTMVPLRFIAESLDKQVGWDNDNRTAIIIDYSYFSHELKKNAPALYHFLMMKKQYATIDLKKEYYDLADPNQNDTFEMKINATPSSNTQSIALTVMGNSELAKDIIAEKWNSITYTLRYEEELVNINSTLPNVITMLNLKSKGRNITYQDLGLIGSPTLSMENMFRLWAGVEDANLKINTFSLLKNDFKNVCEMFQTTNTSESKLSSKSSTIRYANYTIDYFDLMQLDNIIFDNEFLKAFNVSTKFLFKTDIDRDTVLYDYSKITVGFDVDATVLTIHIEAQNDYHEKYVYTITLKHM